MRARLALITLMASTLMLTGCRLSDQQQIGVMKFVANSIAGAIDDGGAVTVAPAKKAGEAPAATPHEQHIKLHALRHVESRMQRAQARVQRCCVRVRTIPARLMISANVQALRQFFSGYSITVAKKRCPRSASTIRS
ncbi:MAG: hypothetical protein ACXVJO_13780 [Thermoanaerobaculia bacterium]